MEIFLTLLIKLIPLYVIILIGYIAGRFLNVQKETISAILIYIIYPVVVFTAVINTNINPSTLSLPLLIFTVSSLLCLFFYFISAPFFKDSTRNLLALGAGDANTVYFGIPVALFIFGEQFIGLYILSVIGMTFYENSLGYFILARGHYSLKESLKKVAKLPSLYAFLLGILVSLSNIHFPQIYFDTANIFRSAFTLLGMMIIGLGLASIKNYKFDFKFVGAAFLAKFLMWPVCIATVIFLDTQFFHIYSDIIHKILILISIAPLAANMVVFATELKIHPDKASLAVLLSTLFALIYIPLMATLFLK